MEINEEVRQELIENLCEHLNAFKDVVNKIINRMRKAKTVEELMRLKKRLLLVWLDSMPLSSAECYFCLLGKKVSVVMINVCKICNYGKLHKICLYEGSDYAKITEALRRAIKKIDKLYVKRGERYD